MPDQRVDSMRDLDLLVPTTFQDFRRIYQRSIARSEAKDVVRDRIAILRQQLRNMSDFEIGDVARVQARIRNRTAQLRQIHRTQDW